VARRTSDEMIIKKCFDNIVHIGKLQLVFFELDCFSCAELTVIDHDGATRRHIDHDAIRVAGWICRPCQLSAMAVIKNETLINRDCFRIVLTSAGSR
jgi:hypothetical protein